MGRQGYGNPTYMFYAIYKPAYIFCQAPVGSEAYTFAWSYELKSLRGVATLVNSLHQQNDGKLAPKRGLSYTVNGHV